MTIKLIYTHPVSGSTTDTFTALAIRGVSAPDEVEFVPPVQHRAMGGTLSDQFAGFRRGITLDLGVMALANQDNILYFIQDEDRQIQTTMTAPTISSISEEAGGSLALDTYYYVVTAVDDSGESASSTEDSVAVTNPNSFARVTWGAVSGARQYNVYRSTTSATYNSPCLLTRTTSTSYDDMGVGTSADFIPGQPSGGSAVYVALADAQKFANEWIDGIHYAARYTLKLRDRSLRTLFPA